MGKIGGVGAWGWLTCDHVLDECPACSLSSGRRRLALPAAAWCLLGEAERAGFSTAVVASAAWEGTLAQLLGSVHHGVLLQRLLNADAGAWLLSSRACAMCPVMMCTGMSAGRPFGFCCGGKSEIRELEQRKCFLMLVVGEEQPCPGKPWCGLLSAFRGGGDIL